MKKPTIFNETSVALKVGTPDLPDSDWQAVVRYLANKFDFAMSPLSFIEVLNSLARGDERFIIPNLRRLEALSPLEPLNPTFLEMPGQFVLREVLGCGPTLVDTYQPWQMKEAMVSGLTGMPTPNMTGQDQSSFESGKAAGAGSATLLSVAPLLGAIAPHLPELDKAWKIAVGLGGASATVDHLLHVLGVLNGKRK